MKNIFKYIIFLFIILISVNFSHGVFAQSDPFKITFSVNDNLFDYKLDNYGNYYYDISGELERNYDKTIYLILQNNSTFKVQTLCTYKSGIASSFNFKYPSSACNIEMPKLTHGVQYDIYFSDVKNGTSKSIPVFYALDVIPDFSSEDVFINWNVDLKKENNLYYYDISTILNKYQSGKYVDIYIRRSDHKGNPVKINTLELSEDDSIIEYSTKNIITLSSGLYEIVVVNKGNNLQAPTQTYIIGTLVPDSSDGSNNGNNVTTGVGSNPGGGINDGDGLVSTQCGYNNGPMCGFSDFMSMLNRIINYIFVLVLPISAIMFTYAGFLYISSAADPKKRTAAKNAMTKLVIGVIIIMLAWIIVKTILIALGVREGFSFLGMRN